MRDWHQTEFATFPPAGKKKPAGIPPIVGIKGLGKGLEQIDKDLDRYQLRLNKKSTVKGAQKIARLYDEAKVGDLIVPVYPQNTQLDFEYSDPKVSLPSEFSSHLDRPIVEAASAVTMEVESVKIAAVKKVLDSVFPYAVGNFLQSHRHSRQGRAEHLVGHLGDALEAKDAYCNLIALLFIHYHSIADQNSELSGYLEKGLVSLLDAAAPDADIMKNRYLGALQLRQVPESPHLDRASQFVFRLFSETSACSMKEKDPVFLFLKGWIIDRCPTVRDVLFEKTVVQDQEQYTYLVQMNELLAALKEKD